MEPEVFHPLHHSGCRLACSTCNLREICLPVGLSRIELDYIDRRLVAARRKVQRGEHLYRAGDKFESLFAVWVGSFKTCLSAADGREQVTGFQMAGELLGLDGIDTRHYQIDAVALEDSQVCVIQFDRLEELAREVQSLQLQLQRSMSREIVRSQGVMLQLGTMYADERLAAFLLNLAHRLQARGQSSTAVTLRMSREDIGSFLGLTVATVSRTFSKLQARGLLFVRNRQIRITDLLGLQNLLNGAAG
jgi:CRP/FNR family transcriptional regulator